MFSPFATQPSPAELINAAPTDMDDDLLYSEVKWSAFRNKMLTISSKCLITGIVVGAIFVILGGVSFPIIDLVVHNEVTKNVVLYKNTTGFQNWENLPGIYNDFYFFTLANKAEVLAGEKPAFVEVGPYSYKQFKTKSNVTYDRDKKLLNYTVLNKYIFDPVRSKGTPKDIITTINVPLFSIAEVIRYWNTIEQKAILEALAWFEDEDIIYDISIQDILWGYEDPLLKLANEFKPGLVPDTHFGFLLNKNNTEGKKFQIKTGKDDVMQTGKVVSYGGSDHLQWWNSKQANAINGSDGTYNHPFWSRNRDEYMFSTDACRSFQLRYEQDTTVHGIPTQKFSVPITALESGKSYPPNEGFCIPDREHCLPDGLLNVSRCQQGAPVIFSLPHFLYADKDVKEKVDGLVPDQNKHGVYIKVEPNIGVALEGALRLQFNTWMEKFEAVDSMKHLRTLPFPVFWVNQFGTVSPDKATDLENYLISPVYIANTVKWASIALGATIVSITLICLAIYSARKSKRRVSVDGSVNNGDIGPNLTTNVIDHDDTESRHLLT